MTLLCSDKTGTLTLNQMVIQVPSNLFIDAAARPSLCRATLVIGSFDVSCLTLPLSSSVTLCEAKPSYMCSWIFHA